MMGKFPKVHKYNALLDPLFMYKRLLLEYPVTGWGHHVEALDEAQGSLYDRMNDAEKDAARELYSVYNKNFERYAPTCRGTGEVVSKCLSIIMAFDKEKSK